MQTRKQQKTTTTSINPNPSSPMQALHFLRLLSEIITSSPTPPSSTSAARTLRRRTHVIRRAAYASMVYAVGPRMAWSRALLRRLRRRRTGVLSPVTASIRGPRRALKSARVAGLPAASRAEELRQLVPGGMEMDMCSLLEETGHYIQCLSAQVKVMQSIADSFSAGGA